MSRLIPFKVTKANRMLLNNLCSLYIILVLNKEKPHTVGFESGTTLPRKPFTGKEAQIIQSNLPNLKTSLERIISVSIGNK